MNYLDQVLATLDEWEPKLSGYLSSKLSPDLLEMCLEDFRQGPKVESCSRMKARYGFDLSHVHALVALSHIRALKAEFLLSLPLPEQMPLDTAARIAQMFFEVGLFAGSSLPSAARKALTLGHYSRKGKTPSTVRGKAAFTEVMEYLVELCRKEGRCDLLTKGNIDGFMKFVQKRIEDNKNQDQFLAERIKEVRTKQGGYFKMQEGYGKERVKPGEDKNGQSRQRIQNELSKLRKKIS
jgi:hypothetical protein